MSTAAFISALRRHVLEPGRELVTDVDLAGAASAAEHSGSVRHVAALPAPEKHPVRALGDQPFLRALVYLEVDREHGRGGAVDDVRERDRVVEHPLGCALEPERVRVD